MYVSTTIRSKALNQLLPRPNRARISGQKGPEILVYTNFLKIPQWHVFDWYCPKTLLDSSLFSSWVLLVVSKLTQQFQAWWAPIVLSSAHLRSVWTSAARTTRIISPLSLLSRFLFLYEAVDCSGVSWLPVSCVPGPVLGGTPSHCPQHRHHTLVWEQQ